jgi:Ca2+-binding EF-hand superfamily protein
MKRSIISLLVVGLFAGTATAALAQNVTPEEQAGATSKSKDTVQKEMTSPMDHDKAMKHDKSMGPKTGKHDKGHDAFKKADKDNDGTLDRKEAKAMPQVAKNFDAIDADKDGTVSLDEVHTFMKARHQADKT